MSKILKDFPYKSQRDNEYNPSGSCNVTSIAMCMAYHGIEPNTGEPLVFHDQLEDELYMKLTDLGWSRHDPYDLCAGVNLYEGVKDVFTPSATFDDIFKAINEGNPVVVHGYFTRFGHIITIKGYDDEGFIVNDPWGEWHSWGYDTSVSGEDLHYSYNLIADTCSGESFDSPKNIWAHVISKVK
jgi:hypothetical protein